MGVQRVQSATSPGEWGLEDAGGAGPGRGPHSGRGPGGLTPDAGLTPMRPQVRVQGTGRSPREQGLGRRRRSKPGQWEGPNLSPSPPGLGLEPPALPGLPLFSLQSLD